MGFDFSGWATRNDLKCSDGRTIRKNAFIDNDGKTVPLVWQHCHDDPMNVLGHCLLENREDGVYAYGKFNDTQAAMHAKEAVQNGDISALSIYANQLKQRGGDVLHGAIREVSLVLSGANPGACIDNPVLEHSDEPVLEEAIIYTGLTLSHAEEEESEADDSEETVQDVLDTLTDKQKKVVYALIAQALKETDEGEEVSHSSDEDETIEDVFNTLTEKQKKVVYLLVGQAMEEGPDNDEDEDEDAVEHSEGDLNVMKTNVFDMNGGDTLMHSAIDFKTMMADAKRCGSLKEAYENQIEALAHADNLTDPGTSGQSYGIGNVDYLFPDARTLQNTPEFVQRDMDWVQDVMNGVHRSPFARIKSIFADITADEARAKGYTKGKTKKEEVFGLLKRTTTPTTIYKKQKMDRDDVIDITDFDVIAWLKAEMRLMLDEEIARAILIGDGRSASDDDKISELNIRPIYKDDDFFTIKAAVEVTDSTNEDAVAKAFIKKAIRSRKEYKGSGNPVLFATEDIITDMLLLEDTIGHKLYKTLDELATAMRVKKIISCPVMENVTRTVDSKTRTLAGIIVNLNDYNVGADKGGAVSMFEDFDIDVNQQKYLIETRCSGALTKPYSAIVLEVVETAA